MSDVTLRESPGQTPDVIAERLAALFDRPFGGKTNGRYRISMKHLRMMAARRRLYPDDVAQIARALYERGFLLIDMETFFVVLSQKTFASYRRVNDACLP